MGQTAAGRTKAAIRNRGSRPSNDSPGGRPARRGYTALRASGRSRLPRRTGFAGHSGRSRKAASGPPPCPPRWPLATVVSWTEPAVRGRGMARDGKIRPLGRGPADGGSGWPVPCSLSSVSRPSPEPGSRRSVGYLIRRPSVDHCRPAASTISAHHTRPTPIGTAPSWTPHLRSIEPTRRMT